MTETTNKPSSINGFSEQSLPVIADARIVKKCEWIHFQVHWSAQLGRTSSRIRMKLRQVTDRPNNSIIKFNQSKSFCSSEEYKVLASNCKATDATLSFHGQKEFSLNQNLWTAMWGAVVPWIEDGGGVGQKAFDEHRKHGRQGVHRTFVYSFRSFWLLLLPKISRPFYVA